MKMFVIGQHAIKYGQFFSFMSFHRIFIKSNTMGVTSGAGTAYPSGVPRSPQFLVGLALLDL